MTKSVISIMICCALVLIHGCKLGHGRAQRLCVVPELGHSMVCEIRQGRIVPLQSLPFPTIDIVPRKNKVFSRRDSLQIAASLFEHVSYNQQGWISCIGDGGKRISVKRYDVSRGVVDYPDILLPIDYKAFATAISGDVLYVGGAGGHKVLGCYVLDAEAPEWRSLDLPAELNRDGKRIDALLLSDYTLIAIDDLVYPKYILVYDITDPSSPVLSEVKSIPSHGVYEVVRKAALGNNWLATLSTAAGQDAFAEHIAIFDRTRFVELGHISNVKHALRWSGYRELENDTLLTWESVAFLDNLLVIACGAHGIGLIDLSQLNLSLDIRDQCNQLLAYVAPRKLSEGEALNLIPVQSAGAIVVVMSTRVGLESFVLTKKDLYSE